MKRRFGRRSRATFAAAVVVGLLFPSSAVADDENRPGGKGAPGTVTGDLPLPDLLGQENRSGDNKASGELPGDLPMPDQPGGLKLLGDKDGAGDPIQDPGGFLAQLAPNGVPGMPHLGGNTEPADLSVQEAREKLFGEGYDDDPNEIRGRAVGNTTWLMSYGGTIAMHDSTVEDNLADTGENADTNGFVDLKTVLAAKPQVIFQDHTHFDQNHHLPEIAVKTGAPVVTSLGGCGWTKWEAVKFGWSPADVNCNLLRHEDGTPMNDLDSYFTMPWGGEGVLYSDWGTTGTPERPLPGGLTDEATLIKHSPTFNRPPVYKENLSGGKQDLVNNADRILKNPPTVESLFSTYGVFDLAGGNYLHKVNYKDFTIARHGSTGYTNKAEPGATKIKNALEKLGDEEQIDLEIGGIAEGTQHLDASYFHDAKGYAKAINAKLYIPTHHFDWFAYWLTNPAATYYPGMKQTWADGKKEAGANNYPDMCFLTEDNYETIWSFDVREWKGSSQGSAKPLTGPGCYQG